MTDAKSDTPAPAAPPRYDFMGIAVTKRPPANPHLRTLLVWRVIFFAVGFIALAMSGRVGSGQGLLVATWIGWVSVVLAVINWLLAIAVKAVLWRAPTAEPES